MRKKIMIILLALTLILPLTSCTNKPDKGNKNALQPVSATLKKVMGTDTDFIVYENQAQEAIEKGKDVLVEIEKTMSLNLDQSEINQINEQAGKKAVKVSPETFNVIKRGLYFSELSKGHFDITIAPITQLWNIGQEGAQVPPEKDIEKLLSLVDYTHVRLNEEDSSVFLEKEGMKIDLGGIAKGYAADHVIDTFEGMGIQNALISVGGNIKVLGENVAKNRGWLVGIQHPRKGRGTDFAYLELQDGETVVTSGDYERYFEEQGERYHHIFDAKKGTPSRTDVISATIVTQDSMDADGLSTSVFVLGSEEGLKMIEQLEGVEAIIVTRDLKVIMTEGIQDRVEIKQMQLEEK